MTGVQTCALPISWHLTPREQQIVSLIERGCSNREIAAELRIELPTVKNHVHHLLEKMGVRRRAAAAAKLRLQVTGPKEPVPSRRTDAT